MTQQPLTLDSLFDALAEGWRVANETRGTSIAYTAIFVLASAHNARLAPPKPAATAEKPTRPPVSQARAMPK